MSRIGANQKRVALGLGATAVVGALVLLAGQPRTNFAAQQLKPAPLATYPGAATSDPPVNTPLALAAASFPNSHIYNGLAKTGAMTYLPSAAASAPAVSQQQALATATRENSFPGTPHNATLVLLQYASGPEQPRLAWIVDATPSVPVMPVALPSGFTGTGTLLGFYVIVIDAQPGDPDAGGVMFQQGGA